MYTGFIKVFVIMNRSQSRMKPMIQKFHSWYVMSKYAHLGSPKGTYKNILRSTVYNNNNNNNNNKITKPSMCISSRMDKEALVFGGTEENFIVRRMN